MVLTGYGERLLPDNFELWRAQVFYAADYDTRRRWHKTDFASDG